MRFLEDLDLGTQGVPMPTGGGGGTDPSGPVLSRRYLSASWVHVEPEPAGALQGFEVCFFTGSDPTATDAWIRQSETLGPTERSLQLVLELRTTSVVSAAVRALYPGGNASAWVVSAAPATFTPDVQTYGESGSVKFPDGTIMQWMISEAFTGEIDHAVTWPTPFPHGCYCVQVTAQMDSADALNDTWFCLRSKSASGCVIFKQASTAQGGSSPTRAHITAWGY